MTSVNEKKLFKQIQNCKHVFEQNEVLHSDWLPFQPSEYPPLSPTKLNLVIFDALGVTTLYGTVAQTGPVWLYYLMNWNFICMGL